MTRIERLKEIIKYRNYLKKKYAKEYKGKTKVLNGLIMRGCMAKFEVSHMEYYNAITLNNFKKKVRFLYNLLDSGQIQNFDLAIKMWRFSKRSVKYSIKDVWGEMLKLSDYPTNKHYLLFALGKEGCLFTENLIKNPLDGREFTRKEWASEIGISYTLFCTRLQLYKKGKISVESLFSIPNHKQRNVKLYKNPLDGRELTRDEWVDELKIKVKTFYKRLDLYESGWIDAEQMFAKNFKVT